MRSRAFAVALLSAALWPTRADAHLVNTGFGPFYDGISHLFVTAPDILVVLALAFLSGLRDRATARATLFGVSASWLVGGLIGLAVAPEVLWTAVTTASFLLVGALLAADSNLPRSAVLALGGIIGLVHGFLNGAEAAGSGIGLVGFVGSIVALFVVLALGAALAVTLSQGWTRIAVRVAGSWIAAVGILMLGWLFRTEA